MPTTHSEMTLEDIEHLIQQRVAEALAARAVNSNNGNENRNEAGNQNEVNGGVGGVTPVAKACTYKDFLNCQPRNFGGTEGVVGLARWFEKMEFVFRISNCAMVHKNEVQKLESELWNLCVKGTDVTGYTRRFQELSLLCPRMVPEEEDKIQRSECLKLKSQNRRNQTRNNEAHGSSGTDRSFLSTTFSSLIDIVSTTLDVSDAVVVGLQQDVLQLPRQDSHLRIEESLRMQDSDKLKGNNIAGPSVVNMVEHNNSSRYNDNKGKCKHHDNTKADPNKKSKVTYWKCGKPVHMKKDCKGGKVGNKANGSSTNGLVDGSTNSLKGHNMFKKSFQVYYVTYVYEAYFVQDDDVACNQMFKLNIVNNIASAFMSTFKLNDSIQWHARLGHIYFKRMQDMSKDGLIPAFDIDTEKWNKKYFVTFIDDASRTELRVIGSVVRLPDLKLKTLGERGIKCIFVGYVDHSEAFRFYVIEPNELVLINLIIESRDAIFNENRFSSVPRPSLRILNGTEEVGGSMVLEEVVTQQPEPELRKGKRNRTPKNFGPEFQLYLIKGTRDEVSDQHSYCFNVEDDPKIFDEAMKSQDVTFWKEAINDKMDSTIGNNTWVLADLPPVARISTIKLLIVIASIHNLIIHQMDVNTAFLNGDLDEELYINQPQGFIILGNENKMCKLIESLYGLKQAPKQWHQKFDEVVLSNGYLLIQADKCIYRKFDESGKRVIICLYVDEMLIFGTNQVQVDLTKEFLSSRFSIKDMGEADVILVSTPMDTCQKLMPNNGQAVSQLKYSRVIGCLMYAMSCTRPDIAFAVGKLSRYTLVTLYSTLASNSASTEVFLLRGGAISWASKKKICITGSIIKYEFVALATASKEAEWLKNLLLVIPLWSKPIAPISIRCDSAATLAKAYSQMYNVRIG
ncbi:zinc finger, CCHC-type containing protein [Tanacetum coccineum]